jgi:hypothetical protein
MPSPICHDAISLMVRLPTKGSPSVLVHVSIWKFTALDYLIFILAKVYSSLSLPIPHQLSSPKYPLSHLLFSWHLLTKFTCGPHAVVLIEIITCITFILCWGTCTQSSNIISVTSQFFIHPITNRPHKSMWFSKGLVPNWFSFHWEMYNCLLVYCQPCPIWPLHSH